MTWERVEFNRNWIAFKRNNPQINADTLSALFDMAESLFRDFQQKFCQQFDQLVTKGIDESWIYTKLTEINIPVKQPRKEREKSPATILQDQLRNSLNQGGDSLTDLIKGLNIKI